MTLLRDIAHTRTGDKGNLSTLSVIAYRPENYPLIVAFLTPERVRSHLAGIVQGEVTRFELPHLHALHFVLHQSLGGGVTRSLALDAHGKCLASALLHLALD
ncbi:MAG: hypothetical protein RIT26_2334 [Pseudomonadota bacterium]|jgi:hypothetical protein